MSVRSALHAAGSRLNPYGYGRISSPSQAKFHSLSRHTRLPAAWHTRLARRPCAEALLQPTTRPHMAALTKIMRTHLRVIEGRAEASSETQQAPTTSSPSYGADEQGD